MTFQSLSITKVFPYIEENLSGDLSLETVADVACFSPFHFHRLFKAITGETLGQYVSRLRAEKAAADLLHTERPVTEIALNRGFSEHSAFTRSFKKYYGNSPTEFRQQNNQRFSKVRQLLSKSGQAYPMPQQYLCKLNKLKHWTAMNATIEVKELAPMQLAGTHCQGPQNLAAAYSKILRWATPQGLVHANTKMVTIYHDSFQFTEADKVRMSACILLEGSQSTGGDTLPIILPGGKHIIARQEIGIHEFEKAWTGLFLWMNENGYRKAEANPFEIYHNNPNEHPQNLAVVDFCIPVI